MSERYRLIQDGIAVAETEGVGAYRDILHYAALYNKDGPVHIEKRVGRQWVRNELSFANLMVERPT
jgi:hypothetical protein